MLAPLRLVPGFFVTATSRRLEIVRERADATGDRNMAGRVRERMRVMAEEAAMLDSDRFEIHSSRLRASFLPASVSTERNAACSKCAPPASRAFHSLKTKRHYLDHKNEVHGSIGVVAFGGSPSSAHRVTRLRSMVGVPYRLKRNFHSGPQITRSPDSSDQAERLDRCSQRQQHRSAEKQTAANLVWEPNPAT